MTAQFAQSVARRKNDLVFTKKIHLLLYQPQVTFSRTPALYQKRNCHHRDFQSVCGSISLHFNTYRQPQIYENNLRDHFTVTPSGSPQSSVTSSVFSFSLPWARLLTFTTFSTLCPRILLSPFKKHNDPLHLHSLHHNFRQKIDHNVHRSKYHANTSSGTPTVKHYTRFKSPSPSD